MRTSLLLVSVIALAIGGAAMVGAQSGPILIENGTIQSDVPSPLVAFPDGTEIMVEPPKGPVQGIIAQRNEVIEGGEVKVYIGGIGAVNGRDGWVPVETAFYFDATGTAFKDAEVEDGWHIVLDAPE